MINVKERFFRLVKYNTRSNPDSNSYPSTNSQLDFAQILSQECQQIGLSNVIVSEHGYVYAHLPSNIDKKTPTIGFIAHMDTSPDYSGENIEPKSFPNYDGGDIKLGNSLILSPKEFPELSQYIGCEIIAAVSDTLLGADDKAGVAEILTAMEYLIKNPQIRHGDIKICFTPDEEVGRGADKFDTKFFGADFAYTIDGGKVGELEYESFNAARAKIEIIGKSVHPGYAKGIMINAADIAVEIAHSFPSNETPSTTEGREGFYHLCRMSGSIESANLEYLIRDFESDGFQKRQEFVENLINITRQKYNGLEISLEIKTEYLNMKNILQNNLNIVDLAYKAMEDVGVKPQISVIRGGTDGSRLSYMGLPCPNIFAGGHNFHGPYEFVPLESMISACHVIAKISELGANFYDVSTK